MLSLHLDQWMDLNQWSKATKSIQAIAKEDTTNFATLFFVDAFIKSNLKRLISWKLTESGHIPREQISQITFYGVTWVQDLGIKNLET